MFRRLGASFCCVLFLAQYLPADEQAATAEVNALRAEHVEWLEENAVAVRTIDPKDDDFSDLVPLIDKIGDARVVALGEQSHGDGAAFVAKHRLIRFLHEKMGFDVLAWESGMFDCLEMDRAILAGKSVEEAAGKGIFPIWGASGHVLPVPQYAATTVNSDRRLEMAGVDCQFSSRESSARYPEVIADFFDGFDDDLSAEDRQRLRQIVERRRGEEPDDGLDSQGFVQDLLVGIDRNLNQARRVHSDREIVFVRRTLQNLLVLDQMRRQEKNADPSTTNPRDKAMGENLAWLANEHFADRKIIVWGASFHFMRNAAEVTVNDESLDYTNTVPMGQVAHALLGDDFYSVMFIAHRGEKGNPFIPPMKLNVAPAGSLEDHLHATGNPYAFVDFRSVPEGHWLREPIMSRPLGYAEMTARWPNVFDAALYTETMFPSTREGTLPEGLRTAPAEEGIDIAKSLEDFRQILIAYDLGFESVLPKTGWTHHDASRIDDYPTAAAWPDVLGHVDTDLSTFRVSKTSSVLPKQLSGPQAILFPLDRDVTTENYATLLLLNGTTVEANVTATSYTSLVCKGSLEGNAFFDSYATMLVEGDLAGRVTSKSYFNLVVTGRFTGRIAAKSSAMIYLLGGFEGDLELARSKVYIAGHTSRMDLERIKGPGHVFLQQSDLPTGEHTIGELVVTVGP